METKTVVSDSPLSYFSVFIRLLLLIISIVVAVYLAFVIFTYDVHDYSFANSINFAVIKNAGGVIGSYISFFLLYTIGVTAHTLPFIIIMSAWFTYAKNSAADITINLVATRFVGCLIWIVTTPALFAIYVCPNSSLNVAEYCSAQNQIFDIPNSGGGEFGNALAHIFIDLTSMAIATASLFVLAVLSLLILAGISLLTIIEKTGYAVYRSYVFVRWITVFLWHQIYQTSADDGKNDNNNKQSGNNNQDPYERSYVPGTNIAPEKKESNQFGKKTFNVLSSIATATKNMLWEPEDDFNYYQKEEPKIFPIKKKIVKNQKNKIDKTATKHDVGISEIQKPYKVQSSESDYEFPSIDLIDEEPVTETSYSDNELYYLSKLLEQKLSEFKINVTVDNIIAGSVVTRFEVVPEAGVKASKIIEIARDLARSMSLRSVRIVDIIEGKSSIGIEIPNSKRQIVGFKALISSSDFITSPNILSLALGRNVSNNVIIKNLAKMPHLLVAGTTGSGKSVGINAMIISMLYKASPDELKMIMIDPKMLELGIYDGIPHLLCPIVTDMKDAYNAINWCVLEMERRYKQISALKTRNIDSYNHIVKTAIARGEPIIDPLYIRPASKNFSDTAEAAPTLAPMPYIVLIIDEFADMMLTVGKKVEELIARITQKARASGIHLILATQRPSVNVVTGLIKANIPSRIAFQVSSNIDSRTIIDQKGAEQLLGNGDMLFLEPGLREPERVHGSFITDDSINKIVKHLKKQAKPNYLPEIIESNEAQNGMISSTNNFVAKTNQLDEYFNNVVDFVVDNNKVSISSIQRHFSLGFNRAARIVDQMEEKGIISPAVNGKREILSK